MAPGPLYSVYLIIVYNRLTSYKTLTSRCVHILRDCDIKKKQDKEEALIQYNQRLRCFRSTAV